MRIHFVGFLLFCLQNGSSTVSARLVKEMRQPQAISVTKQTGTTGHATLCNGMDYPNVSWTLTSSTPSAALEVYFDYTFEEDFETGEAEVAWYTKMDKKEPWAVATELSQRVRCEDIEGKMKSSSFYLKKTPSKCPYKKHDRIQGFTTFTDLQQIPFGYNALIGKLKNDQNHVILCLNVTIYIEIPADYDD